MRQLTRQVKRRRESARINCYIDCLKNKKNIKTKLIVRSVIDYVIPF